MAQGGNVGGRVAGGFSHGGHLWLLVRQHGALHHSGSTGGRSCRNLHTPSSRMCTMVAN